MDSFGNTLLNAQIGSSIAILASFEELNNNGSNSICLGPAESGPAENSYASTRSITLGQVACNTWSWPISLSLFADLAPSASAAVQVYTGPTTSNLLAFTRAQAAAGSGEMHVPLTIIVPTNHRYWLDPTGTVNLGAAQVVPLN